MATEDNVEVVSDYPLEEETPVENDTPENEEPAEEAESSEEENPTNQKEVETLLAQKEHWRKKFQDLDKKVAKDSKGKEPESNSESGGEGEFKHRVEFLLENRDLNAGEYDHLAAVALRTSGEITLESLREAKDSEKEYVAFLRRKAESKSKSPGSTSASSVSKLEKSSEEISKMTPEEHRKYDEQMMKGTNRVI